MPSISPGDFLKVHNNSDQPIVMQWDGRKVIVKPKSVGLASFEHVIHHFGDPVSGSEDNAKVTDEFGAIRYVASRETEKRRLQMRHGWVLGARDPLLTEHPIPDVEIYDQNDERIWTVAEDPDGEHQLPPSSQSSYNQDDQIARLQRQIDLLRKQANGESADLTVPGLSTRPLALDEDVPIDES